MQLYAATKVYQDNYLSQTKVNNGIVGLGLFSPFWYGHIDAATNQASYSISLGSVGNVTISPQLDPFYETAISENRNITLEAPVNSTTYQTGSVKFGKVELDSNNETSSAYYQALTAET